jgi:hypothetical protein
MESRLEGRSRTEAQTECHNHIGRNHVCVLFASFASSPELKKKKGCKLQIDVISAFYTAFHAV